MASSYIGAWDSQSELTRGFGSYRYGFGKAGAMVSLQETYDSQQHLQPSVLQANLDIDGFMNFGCEDVPFNARGDASWQWGTPKLETDEVVSNSWSMLGLNSATEMPAIQNWYGRAEIPQHDEPWHWDVAKVNIPWAARTLPPSIQTPWQPPLSSFPEHTSEGLADTLTQFGPPGTRVQPPHGVGRRRSAKRAYCPVLDALAKLPMDCWILAGIHTLMVHNIPIRYTQEMLMDEWPQVDSYDFLYLPMRIAGNRNSRFAFINFVNPQQAIAFAKRWQKGRLPLFSADMALDVHPAHTQGLDANLLHVVRTKAHRIKAVNFQPAVFVDNVRMRLDVALAKVKRRQADASAHA